MQDTPGWRDRYLTVAWNNILTVVLGALAVLYAGIALTAPAVSDTAAFIGMVLVGAVY